MEVYNLRIKTFPDGTKQYLYCDQTKRVGDNPRSRLWKKWLDEHWAEDDFVDFNSFEEFEKWYHDGSSIERKEFENAKRARQTLYDIVRSTTWDLFVTLTFNDELANGYEYEACSQELKRFSDLIGYYGCKWVFVPEQHPTSGRWHFHGLVKGELPLVESVNPYTGMPVLDKRGRIVYNISCYKLGWSTATYLTSSEAASSYICKYLTKDLRIPKGRNRYWVSKGLPRPDLEYCLTHLPSVLRIGARADYSKSIKTEWGNYLLFELKGGASGEHNQLNKIKTV